MSHWHHTAGPYQRTDRPMSRVGVVSLVGLALLLAYSLSGCATAVPSDPTPAAVAGPIEPTVPTAHAAPAPPLVGTIARCHDGDSCVLSGMKAEVRLFGIDAPEEAFPGRWRRQPGADEARDALLALAGTDTLTCAPRGSSYGRTVAVCTLGPGGTDLGRALVLAGRAWSYGGAYCAEQRDARARRVGLWSDPAHPPTPPWTWRGRLTPRGTCR